MYNYRLYSARVKYRSYFQTSDTEEYSDLIDNYVVALINEINISWKIVLSFLYIIEILLYNNDDTRVCKLYNLKLPI